MVRLQGMTQTQAAAQLGVNQSTISRHLRAVEEEQATEFREEMELFRARQSLVFEHIAQQALAGWERLLMMQPHAPLMRGDTVARAAVASF